MSDASKRIDEEVFFSDTPRRPDRYKALGEVMRRARRRPATRNSGASLPSTNDETDPLMPPKKTASIIGVSPGTLANWRVAGKGPRYIKLGDSRTSPVRYRLSDVEDYLSAMTRTSTVDPGPSEDQDIA